MSTTFVTIDGETGFWMRDEILELWLRLLALHLEEPTASGSLTREIRDQWLLASKGWFVGWVPHNLEQIASRAGGTELVRSATRKLLAVLNEAPAMLSAEILNVIGFDYLLEQDVETARLIDVGCAWLDLLDGKITDGTSNRMMPGS